VVLAALSMGFAFVCLIPLVVAIGWVTHWMKKGQWGAQAFLLFTLGWAGLSMVAVQGERWQGWRHLPDRVEMTESVDSSWGVLSAGYYTIEVEGRRYSCAAGTRQTSKSPVRVVYDPQDPACCREAQYAGHLGWFEWMVVFFGLGLALGALGGGVNFFRGRDS